MPRKVTEPVNVRELAESIAKELFTNYRGNKVQQLRLMSSCNDDAWNFGGWCEAAVADVIEKQLTKALRRVKR